MALTSATSHKSQLKGVSMQQTIGIISLLQFDSSLKTIPKDAFTNLNCVQLINANGPLTLSLSRTQLKGSVWDSIMLPIGAPSQSETGCGANTD